MILNLTNFETFLPEKRPFFLEGIDAFSFPLQVFYSRRIGARAASRRRWARRETLVDVPSPATIYGAGKVVGRLGPAWTLGALSAVTGAEPRHRRRSTAGRALTRRLAAPATAFNVLRLKRELGGAGHIGLIGTGRDARFDGLRTTFRDAYLGRVRRPLASRVGGLRRRAARSCSRTSTAAPAATRHHAARRNPDRRRAQTSPGGWLRVAKEGGKHLLWSAEYTGAGRTLEYNDVGYMARQNLHVLKASVGWRKLEPGTYTVEKIAAFEVDAEPQPVGPRSRAALRAERAAASCATSRRSSSPPTSRPARFDDREVGNGTALRARALLRRRLELASDPRGLLYATLANQTQFIGAGIYATSAQGSLIVHALRAARHRAAAAAHLVGGRVPLRAPGRSARDRSVCFGKLTANSVSATLRASYTFTPQLTLQAYAQAFLAVGPLRRHAQPSRRPTPMGTQRDARRADAAPPRRRSPPSSTRLPGRGAQRQRRVPLGVPARLDDLLRLLALADPDRPGADAGISESRPRSIRTPSATAARRTCSC